MKGIILVTCAMLIGQIALAQSESKSFISISAGPSFATGDFARKDITSEQAGLAETGLFTNLVYGHKFSKYVGGIALLKGKVHGLDVTEAELPVANSITIKIETGRWKSAAAMGGLFVSVPLAKQGILQLSAKALGGAQYTSRPSVQISILERSGSSYSEFISKQGSLSGYGFAYLVGADLNCRVRNKFALVLSLDYNSSNVKLEDIAATSGGGIMDFNTESRTSTVDLGLGVALAF